MKKIALATLLALAVGSASAVELGVQGLRDYSGNPDRNGFGVTLGQKFDKVGVTAGFERFTKGSNDLDRYTLTAGYDVAKFGAVTITPKVGVAYLNPETTRNGWAGTVGVGASYPVTKQVALTADYAYQKGNNITKAYNGNIITTGVKYTF